MAKATAAKSSTDQLVDQLEQAATVLKRSYKQILRRKGVTGCDVGFRYRNNERVEEVCIRIYVDTKLTDKTLKAAKRVRLPKLLSKIPVDVIQRTYRATASEQGPAVTCDPIRGGCAIGPSHNPNGWGTLGITLKESDRIYYLTNAHFALSGLTTLPPDHHMMQPPFGVPPRNIGTISHAGLNQTVDYALILARAEPAHDGGVLGIEGTLRIGTVSQLDVVRKTKVLKVGARTQRTSGFIDSVAAYFQAPRLGISFAGQILVRSLDSQPFLLSGDSGSVLIKESTSEVVGLLHGSTEDDQAAFACHMTDVVSQSGLNLQVLNNRG